MSSFYLTNVYLCIFVLVRRPFETSVDTIDAPGYLISILLKSEKSKFLSDLHIPESPLSFKRVCVRARAHGLVPLHVNKAWRYSRQLAVLIQAHGQMH